MESEGSKSRFRFTEAFDLLLAREVYDQNPYGDPKRWATIQVNMIQITGKCLSLRTLRERMQNLVKKHLAKVESLKGKSGIEIFITELEDLLQQISEIMAEFQKKKVAVTLNASRSSYIKGHDAREESCKSLLGNSNKQNKTATSSDDSLVETSCQDLAEQVDFEFVTQDIPEFESVVEVESTENDMTEIEFEKKESKNATETPRETPTRKRPLAQANILTTEPRRKRRDGGVKQTTLHYLEKKNEQQYELRKREIVLQERKQLLEEQKFQLEKQERLKKMEVEERRLQMEEKKSKVEFDLFNNQQELIKLILKKDS